VGSGAPADDEALEQRHNLAPGDPLEYHPHCQAQPGTTRLPLEHRSGQRQSGGNQGRQGGKKGEFVPQLLSSMTKVLKITSESLAIALTLGDQGLLSGFESL
jgi:hypothetical protein